MHTQAGTSTSNRSCLAYRVRQNKKIRRADTLPMMSLALLMILFFMLTALQQRLHYDTAVPLYLTHVSEENSQWGCKYRARLWTVILDEHQQVYCYKRRYIQNGLMEITQTPLNKLLPFLKYIQENTRATEGKDALCYIKITDKASVEDFACLLDQFSQTGIHPGLYQLDKLHPEEEAIIQGKSYPYSVSTCALPNL